MNNIDIDVTENRVWITIEGITIGFEKESLIALIKQSDTFKQAEKLRVQSL